MVSYCGSSEVENSTEILGIPRVAGVVLIPWGFCVNLELGDFCLRAETTFIFRNGLVHYFELRRDDADCFSLFVHIRRSIDLGDRAGEL
jgi:hypothetical protein